MQNSPKKLTYIIDGQEISSKELEIVTVIYERELEFFRIQARSLGLNLSPEISRIHVILNTEDDAPLRKEVSAIIQTEMKAFIGRVFIWAAKDLSAKSDGNGWLTQQILKLRIAKKIEAQKYVVLDAKNHLIKKANVENFIAPDGRPYMSRAYYSGPLKEHFIGSLDAFCLNHSFAEKRLMPAITPFVLYRRAVTLLIEKLEKIHARSFEDFFLYGGKVSEFALYSAFFLENGINIENAYYCDISIGITLWKQWTENLELQSTLLEKTSDPHVCVFGLHRNIVNSISDQARERIFKIWVEGGLFPETNEAASFWELLKERVASA